MTFHLKNTLKKGKSRFSGCDLKMVVIINLHKVMIVRVMLYF